MKAYVLTHDGLFRNLLVTTHTDVPAAEAWLAASAKVGGEVVSAPEDLAKSYAGSSLVILHNYLAAIKNSSTGGVGVQDVSKFETKVIGAKRCFGLIEELFQNQAPEAAAPPKANEDAAATPGAVAGESETTNNEEDMATKGKKTKKTPKAKKAAGEGKDEFGLRKGTISSRAAAMFARASGAKMAKVKEELGDTFYGLLGRLTKAGHKVKKEDDTIFLTAK